MPQLFGYVERLELSTTLWLLLIPPLFGAISTALIGKRAKDGSDARLRLLGLGTVLGTFALAVWHVSALKSLPEAGRHLYWHGWQMVRIGSVNFDFGLALDPLSAAMLLVVTALGVFAHIGAIRQVKGIARSWPLFTSLHLAIFSTLLFVLADGFMPMLFGLQGLGLCVFLLYPEARSGQAFVLHRIGDMGLLAGALVILWGLGGKWLPDGIYQPDLQPRFIAVSADEGAASPKATSSPGESSAMLTFTALPGAELYLDNARLGASPLVRRSIEAARHSVRIMPGGTKEEHEVNWFLTEAGSETAILPIGPTLVFREIRDQLSFRNDEGQKPIRNALLRKRLFGMSVVTLACLFFCVPVLAQVAQLPAPMTRRALFRLALTTVASVYLLARLWFLFSMTNMAAQILVGLAVLSAIVTLALRARGASRCEA